MTTGSTRTEEQLTHDYSEHRERPGGEAFAKVDALIGEMKNEETGIRLLEVKLQQAKSRLFDVQCKRLPEQLEAMGLAEFTTADGVKVSIREDIRASIKVENRLEALAWLEANDAGSLIKNDVAVTFGKGHDDAAAEFIEELKERGTAFKSKRHVHPQTLGAYVRECLSEGEPIPMELLGVVRQRVAKLK